MLHPHVIATAVVPTEMDILVMLAMGETVLELGTYLGASALAMARTAQVVHTVDWHRGDSNTGGEETLERFAANLATSESRGRIVAHIGTFEQVLPLLRPESFDGVFLDGWHEYRATLEAYETSLELLRDHGWMAFHDYGSGFPGVKQAVDEIAEHLGIAPDVTRTLAVLWL